MATLKTLVSFNYGSQVGVPDYPEVNLIDSAGNLFGTTFMGGANGEGSVFEITYTGGSYASTLSTLVSFDGTDGAGLDTTLIADAAGDLFGTSVGSAAIPDGTVFEIIKTNGTYASTPTTLVSFNGTDGSGPEAGLIADAAGDLFGTTIGDGTDNNGTVFEIIKTNGTYASTPTTLVSFNFNATNLIGPDSPLTVDAAGDLFSTTFQGGANGDGTVFEIAKTSGGYASTPITIFNFDAGFTDAGGTQDTGDLIADAAGDLFGTTSFNGANSDGSVFEIANTSTGYASTPTTLVSFNGADGAQPSAFLTIDAAGDLFGTTSQGGANGDGTVFEIIKTNGTFASTPTTLANFNGTAGGSPLIADADGDLFGGTSSTATGVGPFVGTVFELSGAGFQVTCYMGGTRIATPTGDRVVESLSKGDFVLTVAGNAHPVAWIGRRRVDCRYHPRPEMVWPVRVRAGAFGDGIPNRDLWLSPDHAVFVDDVLIPIKHLINGLTIEQVPQNKVTYYHVELPHHDVLLAEGLPAESYLDTGDRRNFDSGDVAVSVHPDFSARMWEAMSYAPLVITGPKLDMARGQVNARLDSCEPKGVIRQAAA